jgi:long-chain fatty acid transport protein
MQRRLLPVFAATVLSLACTESARAAGFSVFEAGGKALGMGGAFAAQADDPSAVFFNPAGVADLEGVQLYAGVSLIFTGTEFAGVNPDPGFGVKEETGTLVFPPFNAYLTWQVAENVGVGIGVFNPFGLGQEWDDEPQFTGRHIAHDTELRTFDINPTAAWRPHERVSIGAGLQIMFAEVDLKRYLQEWDPDGSGFLDVGHVRLKGNSWDFGFNAGALFDLDDFSIGATYRSKVTSTVEGDATFEQLPSGNPAFDDAVAAQFPESQGVAADVKLPWMATLAGAYRGVERWVFEVDLVFFGWSEFDELTFEFDDPSLESSRVQDYEDKVQIRTGGQYTVNDAWEIRAGYYYDPTPQPTRAMSPLLGDSNRHSLTVGGTFRRGAWYIDGFGLALLTGERSTEGRSVDNFNGTYQSFGFIGGLNFGYNF